MIRFGFLSAVLAITLSVDAQGQDPDEVHPEFAGLQAMSVEQLVARIGEEPEFEELLTITGLLQERDPEGRIAIPLLRPQLIDSNPLTRLGSATVLGNYQPALEAVPELLEALEICPEPPCIIKDFDIACHGAAMTLSYLDEAVPVLIERLGAANPCVRANSALALGGFHGPRPRQAVPALRPLLQDRSPGVRFEAAYAIIKIDREAVGEDLLIPILAGAAEIHDPMLSGRAVDALRYLGTERALQLAQEFDPR